MTTSMAFRVVEEAKQLLEEAQTWGTWNWASSANQDRVRSAIECATAALDREIAKAKMSWSNTRQRTYQGTQGDFKMRTAVRKLKDAEYEMHETTTRSKAIFDEAEREWNAGKAREGAMEARRAIEIQETVLEMARAFGS